MESRGFYLDESINFCFSSFSKRFDLDLADGTHVQVVDCRATSETEGGKSNI